MPFAIRGRFEGIAEAIKALDNVEKKVRKKAIRKAVLAAGTILLNAAKAGVVQRSGLLRKSLGKKVKVYKGAAVAVVGPRVGFKQVVTRGKSAVTANPTKYAHLVEGGVSPHGYKTRAGTHPGSAAKPFLAPALSGTRSRVTAAMVSAINEVIQESAL